MANFKEMVVIIQDYKKPAAVTDLSVEGKKILIILPILIKATHFTWKIKLNQWLESTVVWSAPLQLEHY